MKSDIEINETTKIIKPLAEIATEKMKEKTLLQNTINIYKNYLVITKNIMIKFDVDKDKKNIYEEVINYINNLQNDILSLKEDYIKNTKIYISKYKIYQNDYMDEFSMNKPSLNQKKSDNFVLKYFLKEKENIILGIKKSIDNSKTYNLFREPRRYIFIDKKTVENQFNSNLNENQQKLLYWLKTENIIVNQRRKKEKRIEKLKTIKEMIEKDIDLLNSKLKLVEKTGQEKKEISISQCETKEGTSSVKKKIEKKNSNENFEINNDDNSNSIDNDSNIKMPKIKNTRNLLYDLYQLPEEEENIDYNTQPLTPRMKSPRKKITNKKNPIITNFQNFDTFFDIASMEGNNEALIDTELHSDDETYFEDKINPKKEICKNYVNSINKIIPKIYLSQIEFNKMKIMNDADLYSFQKRNLNAQNIDYHIKIMKLKVKKIKKKSSINKKKIKAMKEFITELKENYKHLKRIFTKSTAIQASINTKINIQTSLDNISSDSDGNVGSDYSEEENDIEIDKKDGEKNEERKEVKNVINEVLEINEEGNPFENLMFKNKLNKNKRKWRAKSK